ncbi:MAG: bifunctional folylpolyglutamate synthase/dihydrofolate synthase, partial [candidate division KSB1 bacterium]|nr:bifunctional folylpolyglutamate synthase/dihydrofolate synthase [candidate division KSB1 bacterium]
MSETDHGNLSSLKRVTYSEALNFLDSRISLGWKLGLESMNAMLAELGRPQDNVQFIHIAGTNGKGSVAALLASICKAAGYKTGLYTSPHLTDVRERIRLNGRMIEKRRFAQILARIRPVVEQYGATYFETLTAAALVYFAEERAEIVCLEVGLGGRLDATNVVRPLVSVITSISLDHTEHLGSTPAQIAVEKAGIIKAGVPCVIGSLPQEAVQVVRNTCRERGAPFIVADQLIRSQILDMQPQRMTVRLESQKLSGIVTSRLVGRRQEDNLRIAAAVCGLLRQEPFLQKQLSAEAFRRGVASCRWPGRFEILRRHPLILVDVAHNLEAMQALKELLA